MCVCVREKESVCVCACVCYICTVVYEHSELYVLDLWGKFLITCCCVMFNYVCL